MDQAYDQEQTARPKLICSLVEAVIEFKIGIRKLDTYEKGKCLDIISSDFVCSRGNLPRKLICKGRTSS